MGSKRGVIYMPCPSDEAILTPAPLSFFQSPATYAGAGLTSNEQEYGNSHRASFVPRGHQPCLQTQPEAERFFNTAIRGMNRLLSRLAEIKDLISDFVATPSSASILSDAQSELNQSLQAMHSIVDETECAEWRETTGGKLLDGSLAFITTAAASSAIEDLQIFRAYLHASGDLPVVIQVTQTAKKAELLVPAAALGNGLIADLALELTGDLGSETFTFATGTTADQIAAMFNLFADSTGVEARITGKGGLSLRSLQFGSKAHVSLSVISEPNYGRFAEKLPVNQAIGRDIEVTVNGVPASGKGRSFSVCTAVLDMDATIAEDSQSGTLRCKVTGGGIAVAVNGHNSRFGIESMRPFHLGSTQGRLFQLGSGQKHCLAEDPVGALRIVQASVAKVTRCRDRLTEYRFSLNQNSAFRDWQTARNPSIAPASNDLRSRERATSRFPRYPSSVLAEAMHSLPSPEELPSRRPNRAASMDPILVQAGPSLLSISHDIPDILFRR